MVFLYVKMATDYIQEIERLKKIIREQRQEIIGLNPDLYRAREERIKSKWNKSKKMKDCLEKL